MGSISRSAAHPPAGRAGSAGKAGVPGPPLPAPELVRAL